MGIKTIKTDADYRAALKEVESLMMAGQIHGEMPDPVEAIKLEMDRQGLAVKDMEFMIGSCLITDAMKSTVDDTGYIISQP